MKTPCAPIWPTLQKMLDAGLYDRLASGKPNQKALAALCNYDHSCFNRIVKGHRGTPPLRMLLILKHAAGFSDETQDDLLLMGIDTVLAVARKEGLGYWHRC